MENKEDIIGQLARLPDGQKVRIESCENDTAAVIRIEGSRKGARAVCAIAKLQPSTKIAPDAKFGISKGS